MTTSAEFLKEKEVVAWLSEISTEGTRDTYSSALCRYWTEDVSKRFPTLKDWVEAVKAQRKSDDMQTRKTWAIDLIRYMKGSVTKLTHRSMSTDYKSITAAAVKSFLRALADEELNYDFKLRETDEEIDSENKPAMTIEEVRKLYEAAQKTRDKALLLVAINGVAPAEMVQFTQTWKKWWPKDITQLKAPFKISLVRHKVHFPYHVTLWQDAVEALKALYAERVQKTGGSVDHLFVMDNGKPFTRSAYDFLWERLRERAGLYQPTVAYEAQRVHAHGVRHFLETQAKLHRVAKDVVEFSIGHKGEQYGYDKSHLEEQWCGIVEKELRKMTDVLNLKTGAAQKYYESKEEEIRIKAMRDFYNTLLKTNAHRRLHASTGGWIQSSGLRRKDENTEQTQSWRT